MDSIPIIQDNEKIDSERHLFQWPSSFNSNLCPSPSCQFMPNCLSSSLYPLTEASPFNLFMQSCDCFNFSQTQSNQTGSSENNAKNLLENDFRTKPKRGRPPSLHKQLNETEGQYRCIFCYFTCKSLHEFLKHIDIHAGPKQPFVCQLCGKDFKYLLAWRNHICSHIPLRPFHCSLCNARYITNGELIRHKRYKHGEGKPHKCEICSYECVELAKLIRHQRMHAGLKPFKCPSCYYESYDKSKIRRHYVTHTREKPFKCELCGSRFTQSGSLKTHLTNVHELDKVEFCCPFCTHLVTTNMGELRNHIKSLHHSTNYPVILNKNVLIGKNFNQTEQTNQAH